MSVLLSLSLSLTARAHEALEEPMARYPTDGLSDNKACPCGVGPNDELCSVSTELSDPNRAEDRVTEYAAGQTITVRLHEVIGHAGRWRVAFDPDGADLADFNANVLLDVPDPPGSEGNVGQGDLWEWQVTLPDVTCDSCTLQVIQVMHGDTANPVPDPTGLSTYYQCADLRLVGEGGGDTAAPADTATTTPGTTDTDPPGTGGTTPPTAGGSGAALDPDEEAGDEAGCACSGAPAAGGAWGLVAALAWTRRRRRRRSAA